MKFTTKYPNFDKDKNKKYLSEGWKRLAEPSDIFWATIESIPFMIINFCIVYVLFRYIFNTDFSNIFNNDDGFSIELNLLHIVIIVGFILLHEILHLLPIPHFLKSGKTYFGIKIYGGFTYTEEMISKNRFLLISVFPFLTLSILFPYVMELLGYMNNTVIIIAFLNGLASCVDSLSFCLVLFQVPSRAMIINNGNRSYFKK